ncbi:MAG TPA: DNA alkylation repair protein [Anaerolineales bacterium]|nr:DNA alkylation repair protein [Anaerolineales bacterium]
MPAIDLARLRKQAARLSDFFLIPEEFIRHLHEMLDSYVNYTVRKPRAVAPGASLRAYRTPVVVVRQIEQEIGARAAQPENADAALELADRLWDEEWLETRILAAFLLGSMPPREERLLARLTAWSQQLFDADLRSELLNTSLGRLRREAPDIFLELVAEWLVPQRQSLWPNGIEAVISAAKDSQFQNLPPLMKTAEPVVAEAPPKLQNLIEELILALYEATPTETAYFVRQVLMDSDNPMTAITFRRIAPSLPTALREEIREFIKGKA